MPFITHDYSCQSCESVEERMVDRQDQDHQICKTCHAIMTREVGAVAGYVRGTRTPTKIKRD